MNPVTEVTPTELANESWILDEITTRSYDAKNIEMFTSLVQWLG